MIKIFSQEIVYNSLLRPMKRNSYDSYRNDSDTSIGGREGANPLLLFLETPVFVTWKKRVTRER